MKQELLKNFPRTIAPLINMALELGISYQEFDALIKEVFVKEAKAIIKQQNKKNTDASISVITGISRMAITQMEKSSSNAKKPKPWISFPSKIVAAWVAQGLNNSIPYQSKEENDFVTLVKGITTEKSTRTILNEMVRLNMVTAKDKTITIVSIFNRSSENDDKKKLLKDCSENIQLHIKAAVNNLNDENKTIFLEESVKVDGIHLQSAKELSNIGTQMWSQASKKFVKKAEPASDEGGKHKLAFGVYCYYK